MKVVVDTSVLIALSSISKLDLLRKLFTLILVPRAVAEEYGEPLPKWIEVLEVKNKQLVRALLEYLHRGEAETITLTIETNADIVILDDKKSEKHSKKTRLENNRYSGHPSTS